jgi:hypothetical protein
MEKLIITVMLAFSFLSTNTIIAETLKDPITRDENISNTILSVLVNKRPDGMYEYIYDMESSIDNKGVINSFSIDLSCDLDFGNIIFSEPIDNYFSGSYSGNGNYVPIQSFGVYAMTTYSSITVDNLISWGMSFDPGQKGEGVKIISPAPPGLRTYVLRPYMESDGWDYGSYNEDDPTVPWIDDFTVTGSITAPACSLDTPSEDERFEGTGREPFGINKLLTYAIPDKDPITVSSDNDTIQVNIFYSEKINKARFKAKLNGKDITRLFNPKPATNETVTITGKWKRLNRLILSVPGIVDGREKGAASEKRPEQSLNTPANENAAIKFNEFKSKDIDTFHIWYNK